MVCAVVCFWCVRCWWLLGVVCCRLLLCVDVCCLFADWCLFVVYVLIACRLFVDWSLLVADVCCYLLLRLVVRCGLVLVVVV